MYQCSISFSQNKYKWGINQKFFKNHLPACECLANVSLGSDNSICADAASCPCAENTGICTCANGYTGDKCYQCDHGFYDEDGDGANNTAICSGILWKSIYVFNQEDFFIFIIF